jgi:hypothetical protein
LSLLLIAAILHYIQEYWRVTQTRCCRPEQQLFGASIIAGQPLWCLGGMDSAGFVKTPPKFPDIWRLCVPILFEPRDPPFSFPCNLASCFFVGCVLVSMWFYNTFLKTVGFDWTQWEKITTKEVLPLPPEVTWDTFKFWNCQWMKPWTLVAPS